MGFIRVINFIRDRRRIASDESQSVYVFGFTAGKGGNILPTCRLPWFMAHLTASFAAASRSTDAMPAAPEREWT